MLNRKVFAVRSADPFRNLFERWWTGEEWLWVDHGRPGGVPVTGSPGAAMLDEKLFVVVDDGSLWERHWRGDAWAWESHGRPANRRIRHGPAAAMMNEKLFVVDDEGSLWERHWRADLGRWAWFEHGRPENRRLVTAPGAAMNDEKLFVVAENGNLWERHWRGDLNQWVWFDHQRPDGKAIVHAPGAAMLNEKLFVVTGSGELYERHWRSDLGRWAWNAHGRPPGVNLASAPGAMMNDDRLFVAGSDGGLHERRWDGAQWIWLDHGHPAGASIVTAPDGAMMGEKLFAGGNNNHLYELFFDGRSWVWVDHGVPIEDTRATVLTGARNRHVIAVIGDGYDESNINDYRDYVQREIVDGVFGRDLFRELRDLFIVHRVDVFSIDGAASTRSYNEQGTPNDSSDDTLNSETIRNTRLRCVSTGLWSHVWIEIDADFDVLRNRILDRFVPDWDFAVIIVNDGQWGGVRRGNTQWVTRGGGGWSTLAHEFGHQIGNLADEYTRDDRPFPGGPFSAINCSASSARASLPWSDLVAATTPLPTDASSPPAGWQPTDVGAFEGCGTFDTGLFRPTTRCRMDNNSPPFCPVCERAMRAAIGS